MALNVSPPIVRSSGDGVTRDGQLLHLTGEGSPEIVVYRSCPLAYLNAPAFRTALRLADFRQPNAWPVQAGMSQRDLMLAMRIPERAFSTASLENALGRLAELLITLR